MDVVSCLPYTAGIMIAIIPDRLAVRIHSSCQLGKEESASLKRYYQSPLRGPEAMLETHTDA